MDMTIDQQVALDEALAFLVTADVPEIYLQEFWATATVHHHSIQFKMDNKKHIINLEYFREMLHICPRLPGQTFDEPPFEEEILAFLRFLGQSGAIRRLTGFYHKRNVDFAYLLWEDFVYQVEHKDTKTSNEMYYPRFTKVIIHYFMSKEPSIPRRNKVKWHYVRDDHMFTTIKLVLRHQNTQQFGAMLPIELTNADIKNSEAYKEYYAFATGGTPPNTKASVRKTKSGFDTTVTPPPTADAGTRLFTSIKGKQQATTSRAKSLTTLLEIAMTEAEQLKLATKRSLQQTHISQESSSSADEGTGEDDDDDEEEGNDDDDDDAQVHDDDQEDENNDEQASDEEGEEFIHPSLSTHDEEETRDEESFDLIDKTHENTDDEGNGEENLGLIVGRKEGQDEEDDADELYRDVNINMEGRNSSSVSSQFVTSMLNLTPDAGIESIIKTTSQMDVQPQTIVAPLPLSEPTLTPSTIATVTTVQQAPTPSTTAPSTLLQNLPNFDSLFGFEHRLKTLEDNFSEFVQTNQFAGAVSSIPGIIQRYMDQQMNKVVKVAVQIQSDRLCDEAQAENDEFLKTIDKNMHKIIKEQVKEQVKKKMKNPSLDQTEGSKRRREGKEPKSASTPKEKATGRAGKSTQGSKSRQTSASESATIEEPMQTTHEMEETSHPEFETGADDQPIKEPSQHPEWFSQQKKPPTLYRDWNKTLPATHESIQPWISKLAKQIDSRSSFNELMDTHGSYKSLVELEFFLEKVYKVTTDQLDWVNPEGKQYLHNLLKPLPLIPNFRGRRVILFDHFINNDLEYLRGGASSCKHTTSVTKTMAADYGHIKWIEDLVPQIMESAHDVYFKRRIIAVIELKIVEWHNYRHLEWITNVYKKHRNPKAYGRPSTRCRKLPEEAQPYKARYVPFLSKAQGSLHRLLQPKRIHLSEQK
uniref:Monodehydroascorbate reductase n=1 Tax=Tanacetum cinerariifolium TaxID=118510 RepID=A0A6L2KKA6_TANCI|nr:hypothetical protein [Tanacetum cinerariifolium]